MRGREAAFILLIVLNACAPVKGYEGPELPPEALSTVTLDYRRSELELGRASTNGVEFGAHGVTLIPGSQSFDIAVSVKEPPRDCRTEYRFDDWNYRSCLIEQRRTARRRARYIPFCNRSDFTSVIDHCFQDTHDGNCMVEFATSAGKVYTLRLRVEELRPFIEATERGAPAPVARGECSVYRSRAVAVEISRSPSRGGW